MDAPPDALTMTDDQVAAIATDARNEADKAAQAVQNAERVLRGELNAAKAGLHVDDLTPARLAELRQAAEHAALLVPAAERRTREIREQRRLARNAEITAKIRAEAADDLDGAEQLIAALDAYESALKAMCEATQAHNQRVADWSHRMSTAGIPQVHEERRGLNCLSHTMGGESVTVGQKIHRPLRTGPLLGAVLYRVLSAYPRDFRLYTSNIELTHLGDLVDSNGPIDLHTLIRKDA